VAPSKAPPKRKSRTTIEVDPTWLLNSQEDPSAVASKPPRPSKPPRASKRPPKKEDPPPLPKRPGTTTIDVRSDWLEDEERALHPTKPIRPARKQVPPPPPPPVLLRSKRALPPPLPREEEIDVEEVVERAQRPTARPKKK